MLGQSDGIQENTQKAPPYLRNIQLGHALLPDNENNTYYGRAVDPVYQTLEPVPYGGLKIPQKGKDLVLLAALSKTQA